jgi:hypothetical protein
MKVKKNTAASVRGMETIDREIAKRPRPHAESSKEWAVNEFVRIHSGVKPILENIKIG